MIPSYKWFPMSLQERAAWYSNFNSHIQVIGASLGFSPAELALIADDTENIKFLALATVRLKSFADAVNQYRKLFTEGKPGNVIAEFPADPGFVLPHPTQAMGAFTRLDDIVRRIRVAPGFTNATATLLDIVPRSRVPFVLHETPPELKASVNPGNEIVVGFIRGRSHGIYIETNTDNAGWMFTEKCFKSPAKFSIPESEAGTPRGVQIRARYLEGNDPVGDWSDTVTVQTIPS